MVIRPVISKTWDFVKLDTVMSVQTELPDVGDVVGKNMA